MPSKHRWRENGKGRGGIWPLGKANPVTSLIPRLILVCTMAACDFPTDLPAWDQRWILPADQTDVGVEKVLPDGIGLTPDSSAFEVTLAPVSFQESLGTLCEDCQILNGLTVPKPPFEGDLQERADLPDEVLGIDVRLGRVRVVAGNGFGFDPIRPQAGSAGTLTISLYNGSTSGPLLDRVLVDGATEAFPPGTTLTRTLEFSGEVEDALVVQLGIFSPLGDPVTIDVTEVFSVGATVLDLEAVSAAVDLSGKGFTLEETVLEVGDMDEEMVHRIQEGAMDLIIHNPWSVGATFAIQIIGPFAPIPKTFSIPGDPTSTARIEFSQEELRTFLGQEDVILVGTGVVDPDAGESALTPGQLLILDTRLDLIIRVGGGES